jgi:secreted trypsin-like serine protease
MKSRLLYFFSFLIFLLPLRLPADSEHVISPRIVGGTEATPGAYPFMTVLAYKGGGSLSSPILGAYSSTLP